jgi:hypothetical protein
LVLALRRDESTLAEAAMAVAPAFALPALAAGLILYATGSRS